MTDRTGSFLSLFAWFRHLQGSLDLAAIGLTTLPNDSSVVLFPLSKTTDLSIGEDIGM